MVKFTVRLGTNTVTDGEIKLLAHTQQQPHLDISDGSDIYTLIMVDPDAPSRDSPNRGDWLHWLVINIQPANHTDNTMVAFEPPSPPKNSGLHRYYFYLFRQTGFIDPAVITNYLRSHHTVNNKVNRKNFPLVSFATQFKLEKPISVHFLTEDK